MDNNTLVGRGFGQQTTATRDIDGFWKIEVLMTEKVIYPDGSVKEESIESMHVDRDFDVAHQVALHSALSELNELVYDRGFDSLIEGKEYERKLEAENANGSKANEDTTTQ